MCLKVHPNLQIRYTRAAGDDAKLELFMCTIDSGHQFLCLAVANAGVDESVVVKIEQQLKKQRFRYYSNVHFPRVIRLMKSHVMPGDCLFDKVIFDLFLTTEKPLLCKMGLQNNDESVVFVFNDAEDK